MAKCVVLKKSDSTTAKLKIAVRALGAIHNCKGTIEDAREIARRAKFNIKVYDTFKKHDVEDD